MSKLYFSETGRVVPTLCEELSAYRHARKILHLPPTGANARLYILARSHSVSASPMRVTVNGRELPPVQAKTPGGYWWYDLEITPNLLVAGANRFEFWTDAPAMNAWSLALENGHREPQSYLSVDDGQTWQNDSLGYLGVCRGEYVVRLRLMEGQDEAPPDFVWESPNHPRLASLTKLFPGMAQKGGSTIDRARALATSIATSWEYRHSGDASLYAPWDPETILAWGKSKRGHDGRLPIVMCVHYGVTMLMACLAQGIPARMNAFTEGIDKTSGHFINEIWAAELNKWVLVDPNLDAVFCHQDSWLSLAELRQLGPNLAPFVVWGLGSAYQRQSPAMETWIKDVYLTGRWLAHRAVWPRTDLLSRPALSPTGHGSTAYCETQWVWETEDLQTGCGMFPYFGAVDYFEAPPLGWFAAKSIGASQVGSMLGNLPE